MNDICEVEFLMKREEMCQVRLEFPAVEIEATDLWISAVGAIFAVYFLYRSKDLDDQHLTTGRVVRVFSEHFRFLLILYTAYEPCMRSWMQVLFDLVFPVYNLSLALYPHITLPLFTSFSASLEGSHAILSWNLGLLFLALLCTCPKSCILRYELLTYFNILVVPDAQLAVSKAFARYGSTQTSLQAAFCFATSIQWALFSLMLPAIQAGDSSYLSTSSAKLIYGSDYRSGFSLWPLAIKTFQFILIYLLHFTRLYFAALPGFSVAIFLLFSYVYRQVQTGTWPYALRVLNFVADDSALGIMLLVLWTRWRNEYLLIAAFVLPLRQSWRIMYSIVRR
jgi:hypothetical protein